MLTRMQQRERLLAFSSRSASEPSVDRFARNCADPNDLRTHRDDRARDAARVVCVRQSVHRDGANASTCDTSSAVDRCVSPRFANVASLFGRHRSSANDDDGSVIKRDASLAKSTTNVSTGSGLAGRRGRPASSSRAVMKKARRGAPFASTARKCGFNRLRCRAARRRHRGRAGSPCLPGGCSDARRESSRRRRRLR